MPQLFRCVFFITQMPLVIGVLRLAWPRINQAVNIFVSNYQIVSRVRARAILLLLFDNIVFESGTTGSRTNQAASTVAIVLTVLVGSAGYLVQALTARRGERVAADEAQKLHVAEATRQREHEYKRPANPHEAL